MRTLGRRLRIGLLVLGLVALASGLFTFTGRWARIGGVVQAQDTHGLDPAELDTTCMPCQDFVRFATGGWTTPITRFSLRIQAGAASTYCRIRTRTCCARFLRPTLPTIRRAVAGSIDQKIGDMYGSCMDTKRIDADAA